MRQDSQPQEVGKGYRGRFKLWAWRLLAFDKGVWKGEDRGDYLVNGPGRCGECHTGRSGIGRQQRRRTLAGNDAPPKPSPNITCHSDGVGDWTSDEIVEYLATGMDPEGDWSTTRSIYSLAPAR